MTNRSVILIGFVVGILAAAAPAQAHHGATNVYDFSKPVVMKGTITKFEWTQSAQPDLLRRDRREGRRLALDCRDRASAGDAGTRLDADGR